ncbi:MAG: aminotransferase [Gammaproteobacteria bacterium]|nr:MAG: aminotransferase [Gammaproteobacteria bacterium]
MPDIESKLPQVGTTIFATMSALAIKHNAINLAQGFPDFDGSAYLKERVCHYINNGANQYAPMPGVPVLNQAIADKIHLCYGTDVSPTEEITVTSGATQGLFAAIHAVIRLDDEAIVFDPAYDSYDPAIELAGGKCVHIPLTEEVFAIDWQMLAESINERTRLIIINSPHNPTGSTLNTSDLEKLWQLIKDREIYLISDEVYEHIIFDGLKHASVHYHAQLAERTFILSSFGKTYHMTGWKVGYCVAPLKMTREFRKIHQFLVFSTSTPMQYGLADMINKYPKHTSELPGFYQQKRDVFREAMQATRFKLLECSGTYFQLVGYSGISHLNEFDFCHWLTEKAGVVGIPISSFYQSPVEGQKIIRFCFAKSSETLQKVGELLRKV